MTENEGHNISIVDTILNKMISNLRKREEFDEETISNFQTLFENGDLTKAKKIIDTLKDARGEDLETN
ncbi:MAG: hypothetical protein EMLJLAPB_00283 [Candidatus Argoarchaeum ethanivorans]|uniref:Uncharacterized protein n=1 Tax=Candidatus Argoarchaeum ethanivorans TaxID=2608793 RepID=A0A811TAG0_9EURY|nr:MAG: hypothetical protein FFODKBPE_00037 [Candidatus Argoarchaeum ethanivorans]CAD6492449.1 MAG: hypothetical protein EMLJLAPB_00283 [Candidatus Argoarchaeum ethanivorans]